MNTNLKDSSMEDEECAIVVKNLSKRFTVSPVRTMFRGLTGKIKKKESDFEALKNISFRIKKGESVGILGENGSGKSTLLQIIANILEPSSGNVQTNGKLAALLELGSGFNPDFSGRENVYLNASILGFSKKQTDQVFDRIEEFADIGEFIDRPISTYSSGMKMRLAFAVQVFVEPEILVVDEALSVGDQFFKLKCFDKINELLKKGITFLFVSHNEEALRRITNRVILLYQGEILLDGTVQECIDKYNIKMGQKRRLSFSNSLTKSKRKKNFLIEQPVDCEETRILSVKVLDESERSCDNFLTGDLVKIEITFINNGKTEGLSAGLRIRNKEGLKIYSWATANYERYCIKRDKIGEFFNETDYSESVFTVQFNFLCNLGSNLYQVEAFISNEKSTAFEQQEVLDWVSEAAFFRVEVDKAVNFFGGVCDLRMKVSLKNPLEKVVNNRDFKMSDPIDHYKEIHLQNPKYGSNNDPAAKPSEVLSLIMQNDCQYVLDYGCGKGVLVKYLINNNITCEGFDPALDQFSEKPSHASEYDCLTCLDVLEHIPYNQIDYVLSDICSYSTKYTLFNIALRKASQLLPDGSNAHLIVQDKMWWTEKLHDTFQSHKIETLTHKSGLNWLLAIHEIP